MNCARRAVVACLAATALTAIFSGIGFAQDEPILPQVPFAYSDTSVLPAHYTDPQVPGSATPADNQTVDNMVTDAGATLGRVLFYDKRLSVNDSVACASCHQQQFGFSDPNVKSVGHAGGLTNRHSMSLANVRYYFSGRMFWDERAATLEDQTLMPIQDSVEMGMNLDDLEIKLADTSYYPDMFADAFGDQNVTSARISMALAQFLRSMISYESRFDEAVEQGLPGNLTPQERHGLALFQPMPGGGRSLRCDACHRTVAQTLGSGPAPNSPPPGPFAVNTGLDATTIDPGAGNGRFKAPSLRNIEVTAPYMHDGRFATLADVVEFYNSGIQPHPNLAPQLRQGGPNGPPIRFNMTQQEKDALIAFLRTLTDESFLSKDEFSNPFPEVVSPESFSVVNGGLRSGTLANLLESDNQKVTIQATTGPLTALEVESVSPTAAPRNLIFTSECSTRSPQADQEIHLFNYATNEYELVDVQSATTLGDKIVRYEASGDLTRFIEPSSLAVKAKIVIRRPGLTRGLISYYDQAVWSIR